MLGTGKTDKIRNKKKLNLCKVEEWNVHLRLLELFFFIIIRYPIAFSVPKVAIWKSIT
jgi:hypothetical protein